MTIIDLVAGYFRGKPENETTLVSTKDDPPKHRLGVLARVLGTRGGRGLGCISFNVVRDNDSEDEHALFQGKRTDEGGGELYFGVKKSGGGSSDDDMLDAMTLTDKGLHSIVPIYAPNLGGGGGPGASTFLSPNGRFRTQFQDDGHCVTYDTWDPNWNTTRPDKAAVWSNWNGLLRPLPWR